MANQQASRWAASWSQSLPAGCSPAHCACQPARSHCSGYLSLQWGPAFRNSLIDFSVGYTACFVTWTTHTLLCQVAWKPSRYQNPITFQRVLQPLSCAVIAFRLHKRWGSRFMILMIANISSRLDFFCLFGFFKILSWLLTSYRKKMFFIMIILPGSNSLFPAKLLELLASFN